MMPAGWKSDTSRTTDSQENYCTSLPPLLWSIWPNLTNHTTKKPVGLVLACRYACNVPCPRKHPLGSVNWGCVSRTSTGRLCITASKVIGSKTPISSAKSAGLKSGSIWRNFGKPWYWTSYPFWLGTFTTLPNNSVNALSCCFSQ